MWPPGSTSSGSAWPLAMFPSCTATSLAAPSIASRPAVLRCRSTAGATATVDFALDRGGSFTGTVRRAGNNQALLRHAGAGLQRQHQLREGSRDRRQRQLFVDALPAGTYFARATFIPGIAVQNVLPELYGGASVPSEPRHHRSGVALPSGFRVPHRLGHAHHGDRRRADGAASISISMPRQTITGSVVADGTSAPLAAVPVAVLFRRRGDRAQRQRQRRPVHRRRPGARDLSRADRPRRPATTPTNGTAASASAAPAHRAPWSWVRGRTSRTSTSRSRRAARFRAASPVRVFRSVTCFGIPSFTPTARRACSFAAGPPPAAGAAPARSYLLEGLPPGTYYLLARDVPVQPAAIQPHGGTLIDELYGDIVCMTTDCDVRRAVPVTVTAGQVTTGSTSRWRRGRAPAPAVISPDSDVRCAGRGARERGAQSHRPRNAARSRRDSARDLLCEAGQRLARGCRERLCRNCRAGVSSDVGDADHHPAGRSLVRVELRHASARAAGVWNSDGH